MASPYVQRTEEDFQVVRDLLDTVETAALNPDVPLDGPAAATTIRQALERLDRVWETMKGLDAGKEEGTVAEHPRSA